MMTINYSRVCGRALEKLRGPRFWLFSKQSSLYCAAPWPPAESDCYIKDCTRWSVKFFLRSFSSYNFRLFFATKSWCSRWVDSWEKQYLSDPLGTDLHLVFSFFSFSFFSSFSHLALLLLYPTSTCPRPPNPYIFWKLMIIAIQKRIGNTNTKT